MAKESLALERKRAREEEAQRVRDTARKEEEKVQRTAARQELSTLKASVEAAKEPQKSQAAGPESDETKAESERVSKEIRDRVAVAAADEQKRKATLAADNEARQKAKAETDRKTALAAEAVKRAFEEEANQKATQLEEIRKRTDRAVAAQLARVDEGRTKAMAESLAEEARRAKAEADQAKRVEAAAKLAEKRRAAEETQRAEAELKRKQVEHAEQARVVREAAEEEMRRNQTAARANRGDATEENTPREKPRARGAAEVEVLTCPGCLKELRSRAALERHSDKCLDLQRAESDDTEGDETEGDEPEPRRGTGKAIRTEGNQDYLALIKATVLATAPSEEQTARNRLASMVEGLVGTRETPRLNARIRAALAGGPLANPIDAVAVAGVTVRMTDEERRILGEFAADERGFKTALEKAYAYSIAVRIASGLLQSASSQNGAITLEDAVLHPERATERMEVARVLTGLGLRQGVETPGASHRPNYPQRSNRPQRRGKPEKRGDKTPVGDKRCYGCGKTGHVRAQCPEH